MIDWYINIMYKVVVALGLTLVSLGCIVLIRSMWDDLYDNYLYTYIDPIVDKIKSLFTK